jgi:hypothetical protein
MLSPTLSPCSVGDAARITLRVAPMTRGLL